MLRERAAKRRAGVTPHRQARPRMMVARCDRVRRSGVNLVIDGSPPPRSGAVSEGSFHGDQHGFHVTRHRGMASAFCSAQTRAQYGLRGVRVGEASHPGPGSKRRGSPWLPALQRSLDSDGESSEDDAPPTQLPFSFRRGPAIHAPPPPVVVDALEC